MKEKIVKLFKKIRTLSLLDFLLKHKMNSISRSIDLKGDLIVYHREVIGNAERTILDSKELIGLLQVDILYLKDKIDLIEKV